MLGEIFDWDKIMTVCYGIFYFLILNILFVLSNIPMFAFVFGIGITKIGLYYPLFFLCLVPLGPSLCAMFYCMDKLIKNKDIYPWKEYIKGYKKNFLQAIVMSVLELAILFMLVTNILYFVKQDNLILTGMFSVLFLIIILMTPNLYLLIMKFKMSIIELLKASITITISKPVSTLGNVSAFLILLALFEITAGTTILFIGSVYAFLIVFMNKKLLKELIDSSKNQ